MAGKRSFLTLSAYALGVGDSNISGDKDRAKFSICESRGGGEGDTEG